MRTRIDQQKRLTGLIELAFKQKRDDRHLSWISIASWQVRWTFVIALLTVCRYLLAASERSEEGGALRAEAWDYLLYAKRLANDANSRHPRDFNDVGDA